MTIYLLLVIGASKSLSGTKQLKHTDSEHLNHMHGNIKVLYTT